MEFRHPKTLYLRAYPNRHRRCGEWVVCDKDRPDDVRNVDVVTQYNAKGWELPNEPVVGLRIKNLIVRRKKTLFVIEDPRKFTLQVRADIFWSSLGKDHSMIGQVIQNACVWAFTQQGHPVPLSVSSDAYINSVRSYHIKEMDRISLRDIQRGNRILLRDGKTVEYLGLFRTAGLTCTSRKMDSSKIEIDEISKRYLYIEHKGRDQYLISNSTLNAVDICGDDTLSLEECQDRAYSIPSSRRDWYLRHQVYMAPVKFNKGDIVLTLRSIDQSDLDPSMRPFVLTPKTGDFYDITDWRVSTIPYRGALNLKGPVRFLPVTVKPDKRSLSVFFHSDARFDDRLIPTRYPLYVLEASVEGEYSRALSGHLPR